MKRRHLLQTIVSLPALAAMPAVAQQSNAAEASEHPAIALTAPDGVAANATHFFRADEMAALDRLCVLMVPSTGGQPGAREAGVPEFLDFLVAQSPADRQNLYRTGIAALNQAAFTTLSADEARAVLAPLNAAWTYAGPSDALGRFLWAAKDDILRATINSREWAATSQRRAAGVGTYWLPVE